MDVLFLCLFYIFMERKCYVVLSIYINFREWVVWRWTFCFCVVYIFYGEKMVSSFDAGAHDAVI
jgi:hypothetical protein